MAKSKPRSTPARKTDAAPRVKPAPQSAAGHDGSQQPTIKPQVTMTLSHDQIARKAYEIWVAKGRPPGQDEQNWREAEAALHQAR